MMLTPFVVIGSRLSFYVVGFDLIAADGFQMYEVVSRMTVS
jgi:hypothetical protein